MNTQIVHTQAVVSYTRLIAVGEGLDPHQTDLLEIAAWLHDIGCPNARALYGDTRPEYQQREGRTIVNEWFKEDTNLTGEEKAWLADTVGTHHQFPSAQALHSMPLFEADLIVNMWEGQHKRENVPLYHDTLMTTETGKRLFASFFLRE